MKLRTIILLTATLITHATIQAASCYSYNKDAIDIKWTAFKTPKKVGVSGKLPNYSISGKDTASSVQELLKDQKIDIALNKVDSGNPTRDTKIVKFFFSGLSGSDKMSIKVSNVSKDIITMNVQLNGKSKEVPLKYKVEGMKLVASGHMDILDFAMNKQLSAINKACYALHEGKTWSDVALTLETTLTSCK